MSTDYSFFQQTLHQQRLYRVKGLRQSQWIAKPHVAPHVRIISDEDDNFIIRAPHVMNLGNPVGVSAINERFNITLPQEFDDFYRLWDGGLLIFQEFYPLMTVRQIIDVTLYYRAVRAGQEPPDLPFHLIRFCDWGDSNYIAMRLNTAGDGWEVFFASCEYLDRDMIYEREEHKYGVLDPDFPSWLNRMIQTDGWPIGGKDIVHENAPPPAQRLDAAH